MGEHGIPQSRTEAILQNMLGEDNVLDPPQSRVEALLTEILENGGSGSGAPGRPGKDGVTPDITMTASVDGTSGTPNVNITKGGTKENPTFDFEFSGLKGQPGEGASYDDTEIWKVQGELGAKNLLKYPYNDDEHKISNGIEYTDNDGVITVNGTASGASSYTLARNFKLKPGKYKIADFCQRTGGVNFNIDINNDASGGYISNIIRVADGLIHEFEITPEQFSINAENGYSFSAVLYINSGVTIDNLVFYPMVWHSEDTNNTWQPYAPTNRELNERINDANAEINDIWKAQGELGAKNLLVYPYADNNRTRNGITWVANNDGSITINGQIESGKTYSYIDLITGKDFLILEEGQYRLTVASRTERSNAHIEVRINNWGDRPYVNLARIAVGQNGQTFTITAEMLDAIKDPTNPACLYVIAQTNDVNEVFDNLTIYPMIRLASDPDDTWQPYVPTNKELVEELKNVANFVWEKEVDELPSYEGISRRYYPFKFEVGTKYEIQCDISAFTASASGVVAFNLRTANGTSVVEDISGEINYNDIKTGIYTWTLIPKQAANTLYLYYNVAVEPIKITLVINSHVNMNNILPITGEYLPTTANGSVKKYSAAIGATTATFNASAFMSKYNATSSDLNLDISAETASGNVLAYNNVTINSSGVITITFDELTEQATFVCKASKIQ